MRLSLGWNTWDIVWPFRRHEIPPTGVDGLLLSAVFDPAYGPDPSERRVLVREAVRMKLLDVDVSCDVRRQVQEWLEEEERALGRQRPTKGGLQPKRPLRRWEMVWPFRRRRRWLPTGVDELLLDAIMNPAWSNDAERRLLLREAARAKLRDSRVGEEHRRLVREWLEADEEE